MKKTELLKERIKEIENDLEKNYSNFFGEPLSQKTRNRIVEECIKPYIDANQYELIYDETNNTPEDIINQKVVVDIKSKFNS